MFSRNVANSAPFALKHIIATRGTPLEQDLVNSLTSGVGVWNQDALPLLQRRESVDLPFCASTCHLRHAQSDCGCFRVENYISSLEVLQQALETQTLSKPSDLGSSVIPSFPAPPRARKFGILDDSMWHTETLNEMSQCWCHSTCSAIYKSEILWSLMCETSRRLSGTEK